MSTQTPPPGAAADAESRLQEIIERERNASRPPWRWYGGHYTYALHSANEEGITSVRICGNDADLKRKGAGIQRFEDALFIEQARLDIPWLVALCQQQAERIEELEEQARNGPSPCYACDSCARGDFNYCTGIRSGIEQRDKEIERLRERVKELSYCFDFQKQEWEEAQESLADANAEIERLRQQLAQAEDARTAERDEYERWRRNHIQQLAEARRQTLREVIEKALELFNERSEFGDVRVLAGMTILRDAVVEMGALAGQNQGQEEGK